MCVGIRRLFLREKTNKNSKFKINFAQELTNVIDIYCKTIEISPEEYIKDAITKDLIRTFVDIQPEEYIYLGNEYPEVKKPLKPFFNAMESTFYSFFTRF